MIMYFALAAVLAPVPGQSLPRTQVIEAETVAPTSQTPAQTPGGAPSSSVVPPAAPVQQSIPAGTRLVVRNGVRLGGRTGARLGGQSRPFFSDTADPRDRFETRATVYDAAH